MEHERKPCPFDNYNCMCQFCKTPCNNGLNCSDCNQSGKIEHTVYLCTGFDGCICDYVENWKKGKEVEENGKQDDWTEGEKPGEKVVSGIDRAQAQGEVGAG